MNSATQPTAMHTYLNLAACLSCDPVSEAFKGSLIDFYYPFVKSVNIPFQDVNFVLETLS